MKLTKDQVEEIMCEECIKDEDGNLLFELLQMKIVSFDQEKCSVDKEFIIEEIKTGKTYKGILGESPWYLQDEYNANVEWIEITKK